MYWKPSLVAVSSLLLCGAAFAQSGTDAKTTDQSITSHVYELAALEPTPERLARIKLPDGFQITRFAELENPRILCVAPNGDIYVSQRNPGFMTLLRDTDGDGVADVQKRVAKHANLHGLAIHNNKMYYVTINELFVADIKPDGTLGTPRLLMKDLPNAGQHPNRTIGIGPDGMLYVSVGSSSNSADEKEPEMATMLRFSLDGKNKKIYASGLRNTIGFAWHPTTNRFWGMDNGIDWLGDDEPREELNEIVDGGRYGWPFISNEGIQTPDREPPPGYTKDKWEAMSKKPVLTYTAHSAPMQMAFYTSNQFPAEYKNDAFVCLRGSWNRKPPSGYEVVRIRFDAAGNAKEIVPFLGSFVVPGGAEDGKDGHMGRLVGAAVARDGSLLITDDTNNTVYRVAYVGAKPTKDVLGELRVITRDLPGFLPGNVAKLTVSSPAFANGFPMPPMHSVYDKGISPALQWSGVPAGTKSIAIVMEDPDARNPKPLVHWLIANIPPEMTGLSTDVPLTEKPGSLGGGLQGANTTGAIGYYGPKPPAADGAHHYHFQVFALDTMLNLPSGYNRHTLLEAMRGHIVGMGQIVGTFDRD